MRKPIIAGNWKMFKTRDEALAFIYQVNEKVPSQEIVDSVICSQFTVLRCLVKRQGENLRIGAQNMHYEEQGAYTGEIAPMMLTSLGVEYVIIGHSERRAMFNETDEAINKKLHAAFKHGLTPILCVGEHLTERENGTTNALITGQLAIDLAGLTKEQVAKLVIAYEPIWAIGTGKSMTPEMADEIGEYIISVISEKYSEEIAEKVYILYGGSVKPENINEYVDKDNIDGVLVGGASLQEDSFLEMIEKLKELV